MGLVGRGLRLSGILLIFGFILYQIGLSALVEQITPSNRLPPPAALGISIPPDAIIPLQFIGGILALAGLVLAVSNISGESQGGLRGLQRLLTEIDRGVKELNVRVEDLEGTIQKLPPAARCKFCGNPLQAGVIFCPMCDRSQI